MKLSAGEKQLVLLALAEPCKPAVKPREENDWREVVEKLFEERLQCQAAQIASLERRIEELQNDLARKLRKPILTAPTSKGEQKRA